MKGIEERESRIRMNKNKISFDRYRQRYRTRDRIIGGEMRQEIT